LPPGRLRGGPGIRALAALALALMVLPALAAPAGAQLPTPHIDNVLPARGQVGSPVAIIGTGFGERSPLSGVTFNGVDATPITWSDTFIATVVPEGATTGPVVVRVLGVLLSNGVEFEVTDGPDPAERWYLAEGSTSHGFETYVLMQNTADVDATVNVVYNTTMYGRVPRPQPINIPPGARVTLYLNDDIPDADVSTILTSSQPIVAERAVYWNNRIEGHESIGATAPSGTWYIAEGSTAHGFETWILVQNPQFSSTTVRVTYMTSKGIIEKAPFDLGPGRRASIAVAKDVGACDVSAVIESDLEVVCERAVYWDGRRGGHCSIGVTEGSANWYLAEGTTAWGYQTWLLLQNPGESEAGVAVTYMTPSGPVAEPQFTMGPGARHTILVNDRVQNQDTAIEVVSDSDIIAERSMYWDNGTGKAGHGTVGSPYTSTEIYLAEGSTAWGLRRSSAYRTRLTGPPTCPWSS
jgi:hypothetical protein